MDPTLTSNALSLLITSSMKIQPILQVVDIEMIYLGMVSSPRYQLSLSNVLWPATTPPFFQLSINHDTK